MMITLIAKNNTAIAQNARLLNGSAIMENYHQLAARLAPKET